MWVTFLKSILMLVHRALCFLVLFCSGLQWFIVKRGFWAIVVWVSAQQGFFRALFKGYFFLPQMFLLMRFTSRCYFTVSSLFFLILHMLVQRRERGNGTTLN